MSQRDQSRQNRPVHPCTLAAAALLLVLVLPAAARAQWTQPDASGNTNYPNGNVGVGTATPSVKLDVGGWVGKPGDTSNAAANVGGDLFAGNTGPGVGRLRFSSNSVEGFFSWNSYYNGSALKALDTAKPAWIAEMFGGGGLDEFHISRAAPTSGAQSFSQLFTVRSGGNVGVGTAVPQTRLDVSGGGGLTVRTGDSSPGLSFFDRPTTPGSQAVIQGNRGDYSVLNVTTAGADVGAEKVSALALWTVDVANTGNATQFQLQHSPAYGGLLFTQKFGTGAQGDKRISMQSGWDGAAAPTQLVLDVGGNVGVGTAIPAPTSAYRLYVGGGINAAGAITGTTVNATFQDVAEWVPSVQKLPAGTVVVLDSGRTNHVMASGKAYDTKVAGVVSGSPGVILGVGGEGKLKVATTGRVKVRVDATRAPIEVGDLLVTSGVEGVAMRSVPVDLGGTPIHRPGTIIGKALEPLASGVGEILVLLSLQ